MPSPSQAGGLDAVAVEVVLADPARRARAERAIDKLFDLVDYTIEWGNDAARLSLMKSVMPAILRSVHTAAKDAEMDRMRADYDELRSMMMGLGTPSPDD